jgi:protein-S-isoprenylcysteine O-methyltransferase Ste14
VRSFLRRHGQTLINIFLVICLGNYSVQKAREAWEAGTFDFVEVAFALHNVVFLTVILARRQHQAIDRNIFHQVVALVAFFSGITLKDTPDPHLWMLRSAQVITFAALALATISLVNLGRSFGILIAVRRIKTGGLYAIVRHPMYFTDILWRVGMILKNPCALNAVIVVVSSAAYVYRALLEEEFLGHRPEYQEYMKRVKYRFIPGLF